jgi:hypothetical protein
MIEHQELWSDQHDLDMACQRLILAHSLPRPVVLEPKYDISVMASTIQSRAYDTSITKLSRDERLNSKHLGSEERAQKELHLQTKTHEHHI